MDKIEKIKYEFQRIKELGFVKSNRSHNTGIGKTFEDLLGVNENNKKDTDFLEFEVKSQRFLTGSKITLFTKSPSFPEKANYYFVSNYGEPYSDSPHLKRIHTSFYGHKFNKYINKFAFKLDVNKRKKKIFITLKDILTDQISNEVFYYSFKDLETSISKLTNLFVVIADTKIIDGVEHFHYTKATVFLGFKFNKFLDMIKSGSIQYDIRIGSYKSGINLGKPHDHGSGFRVNRNKLKELYSDVIILD